MWVIDVTFKSDNSSRSYREIIGPYATAGGAEIEAVNFEDDPDYVSHEIRALIPDYEAYQNL